ncbi:hypothetical protein Q673_02760 [Marinobacter sp. EN3]|uniref:hypothetical protein n=1 Tax=Marinobacter sp. EN3 TaxID=1397533 RepID=UPI0003B91592|nr:hypothetical protein [Marinobacter sp. EN3]ERS12551.1 hypothetical protein Q673_02760 [Marinobacter sp. EN3]
MSEGEGLTWLQVLDAIMRWIVALAGWGIALLGWRVRGRQTREIADNAEINKSIEAALGKIEEMEAVAVEFWKDADSKIVPAQLTSSVVNCTFYTQQICKLSPSREFPAKAFAEVRKSVTMNMEHSDRGVDAEKARISRMVRQIAKLKREPIYQKQYLLKK